MKGSVLVKNILFDGNNLCLDFINTIHNRYAEVPRDYLINKDAWIEWLQKQGLLENGLITDSCKFNLQQIRQLRELLYRLVFGIMNSGNILKKDISEYNFYVSKWKKATMFSVENGIPYEEVNVDSSNLNSYLLLIVEQAHQLLLIEDIKRIKECSNCGWLFLDISKSNRRKWCNMKTCGNEVKARRHYQRNKILRE